MLRPESEVTVLSGSTPSTPGSPGQTQQSDLSGEAYYMRHLRLLWGACTEDTERQRGIHFTLDCHHLHAFNKDLYFALVDWPNQVVPIMDKGSGTWSCRGGGLDIRSQLFYSAVLTR